MTAGLAWPAVLGALLRGESLDHATARWAMDEVMGGRATDAQVSAFLVLLRAKGETVAELRGLADGMLAHARPMEAPRDCLDIVGTGGDQAQTVNISTMSSVVCAAAGVPVVKHGNRASSSRSGSADVLEALGVDLRLPPEALSDVLAAAGITFCFAQTFHPSMRHAAGPRKEIGVPTTFNLLGPLTNPARPRWSAIGCAVEPMAPLMAGVLAERGSEAAVFRGGDGLDEVTTATTTHLWWVSRGVVAEYEIDPRRLGLALHPVDSLRGGDAAHNAQVARDLFDGREGPVRDAVLLNAGVALAVVEAASLDVEADQAQLDAHLRRGMDRADRALHSGAAAETLRRWSLATTTTR